MFRNHLMIALRTFRKHSLYSSINGLGLALGLTVVILIGLFVWFEFSYDRFHEKADRTFRIVQEQPGNEYLGSNRFAVTPAPLESALEEELSYVERATQINDMEALVTRGGETGFFENGIRATNSFLEVFDFEVIRGDPGTALDEPGSILVTPDMARALFDTEDVIGEEFELHYFRNQIPVHITGLIAPPPRNTHFDFQFVLTYAGDENHENGAWGNNSYYTYVTLRPGSDPQRLESDVYDIVERNMSELSWIKDGSSSLPVFYPQQLTDIHLRSHINFEIAQNGDIRYVWLLMLAAGIIMFTACINYMNLATARAGTRAREVAVRKASGATGKQLAGQFLGESVFMALLASLLALVLAYLLLPGFNILVERAIPPSAMLSWWFLGLVPLLGAGIGMISGSYPAIFLSRFSPSSVLRTGSSLHSSRSRLRNSLVVAQFAVGVVMVIGTLVIQGQLRYIRQADTGIERDHVVAVTMRDRSLTGNLDALKDRLGALPGVTDVASASSLPTNINSSNGTDDWDGHEEGQEISIYTSAVDHDYLDMLGLELIEGRNFMEGSGTDAETGMIINETAMRRLGWETAVGKRIDLGSNAQTVIGVVKDFRFHSFHLETMPLALYMDPGQLFRVLIKVEPANIPATLTRVEETFAEFSPAYPFDYQFLDDAYDALYRAEQRLGLVLSVVTVLALVIACLGLFGLAAFMAVQRTREIGVRKALGADIADILLLLSKDFGRLVLVAFLVGSPIAYFAMRQWLNEFAFRIDIGPGMFLTAALFMAVVAFLTVGYQSLKASLTNPVTALRHE